MEAMNVQVKQMSTLPASAPTINFKSSPRSKAIKNEGNSTSCPRNAVLDSMRSPGGVSGGVSQNPPDRPCKYFLSGDCSYGERCRFPHRYHMSDSFTMLTPLKGHEKWHCTTHWVRQAIHWEQGWNCSFCKKPIIFFLKDVWKDGNITRGSYVRSTDRDDLKRKVFCFRSPPLPDIDEIQVSASPLSKRWHLAPRRLCSALKGSVNGTLFLFVRQCGRGTYGSASDSL